MEWSFLSVTIACCNNYRCWYLNALRQMLDGTLDVCKEFLLGKVLLPWCGLQHPRTWNAQDPTTFMEKALTAVTSLMCMSFSCSLCSSIFRCRTVSCAVLLVDVFSLFDVVFCLARFSKNWRKSRDPHLCRLHWACTVRLYET